MPVTVLRSATMALQLCCFHTRTPVGRGCFSMCFLRIMCQLKRLSLDCVLFQSRENCHQKKPDHPKCQPVFASQPTWLLQYCCFRTRTPCYLSCPPAGPWGKLASTSCARRFNSFWSSDEQTSHGMCSHLSKCTQFSCAKAECEPCVRYATSHEPSKSTQANSHDTCCETVPQNAR